MIENNQEVLFQVIRIFSEKDQEWLPAIKEIKRKSKLGY